MKTFKILVFTIFVAAQSAAQAAALKFPVSFDSTNNILHNEIPFLTTTKIDVDALTEQHKGTNQFAVPMNIQLNMVVNGMLVTTLTGQKVLLFRVRTPNALSMNAYIRKIENIPANTQIWYYSGVTKNGIFEADTSGKPFTIWYKEDLIKSTNSLGEIWTSIVLGENFVIEILFPLGTTEEDIQKISLLIDRVHPAFREFWH